MANLTETAYYTRRTINWMILGIFAYFILRALWGLAITTYLTLFPPKAPPPNHAFGKLPALKFPINQATSPSSGQASPAATLTYRLETIEGSVPRASESATVYFMPKNPANLLALTKTQDFAKQFDFDPTPKQETKNIYRFDDPDTVLRKLRYDIVSNNFIIRYGFEQDTGLFTEREFPLAEAALAQARGLLQTYDLYPPDIAGGSNTISFLKLSGIRLAPTTSLSVADAIRIDFFRKPVGDTKIVTPFPNEGPISVIYSGAKNQKKRLLQFAYTFWPIDYQTTATYGLKPSSQAWQELQSGSGYIARYPTTGTVAVIRNVSLGYYDSYDPQTYLQPVFIFEGDFGFLAYVPAVAAPWTE